VSGSSAPTHSPRHCTIHPLVQHRKNLNKARGPEPGAIPCSGPRSISSYLTSPSFGDQFKLGASCRLPGICIYLSVPTLPALVLAPLLLMTSEPKGYRLSPRAVFSRAK
jgi:hypothetical protein